jgi:hypothetical protein
MSFMAGGKHRRWRWVVAAAALGIASFVLAVKGHRSPFAFLERFHPRHVRIDFNKVSRPAVKVSGQPVMTMLLFDYRDADAVLDAMKKELSSERGYSSRQLPYSSGKGEASWDFFHGPLPPPTIHTSTSDNAYYIAGVQAAMLAPAFESGSFRSLGPALKTNPPKACLVLVVREDTWVERTLAAVRAFLHW